MDERNPQKQAPASIAVSDLLMVYSYVPLKVLQCQITRPMQATANRRNSWLDTPSPFNATV